jgi:hypothetical protein
VLIAYIEKLSEKGILPVLFRGLIAALCPEHRGPAAKKLLSLPSPAALSNKYCINTVDMVWN